MLEIVSMFWERLSPEYRAWAWVGAGVFVLVEVLGQGLELAGKTKFRLALGLGPSIGMLLYYLGQVDVPLHGEYAPQTHVGDAFRHWLGCAFGGFGGTVGAIFLHNVGLGRIMNALGGEMKARMGKSTGAGPGPAGGTP